MSTGRKELVRLGFLFNHDTVHQVPHSAPVLSEILRSSTGLDVSVLTSSRAQESFVKQLVPEEFHEKARFICLQVPRGLELLDRAAGKFAPLRRIGVLKANLAEFARLDALVVAETTSTLLKSRFGLSELRMIYTQHGAGDRAVGFKNVLKNFDFVLVAGRKVQQRMLSMGLIQETGNEIVGYPKFDLIRAGGRSQKGLFPNDRPTVLYNPHFEPYLSSWYAMGEQVLNFFADNPQYNLVVAPHVMLHRRRFHVSLDHKTVRRWQGVPDKYLKCSNIIVDLGGPACVDMTYTRNADVYLGDVSSQVYEFLVTPRPCIFLNSHRADWRKNENYAHWSFGRVIDSVAELPDALENRERDHVGFRPIQEQGFADTFDLTDEPSSLRAARAISRFCESL